MALRAVGRSVGRVTILRDHPPASPVTRPAIIPEHPSMRVALCMACRTLQHRLGRYQVTCLQLISGHRRFRYPARELLANRPTNFGFPICEQAKSHRCQSNMVHSRRACACALMLEMTSPTVRNRRVEGQLRPDQKALFGCMASHALRPRRSDDGGVARTAVSFQVAVSGRQVSGTR